MSTQSREAVDGTLVDLEGSRYYRIRNYDAMNPFFMSVVSDSDHWLFLSSTGGLTAGRREPDNALFPYYTDDRIHDGAEHTGAKTLVRVTRGGETLLWEPFSVRQQGVYATTRTLYKSVYGNRVVFEEENASLGLRFRYSWSNSERFGFVRESSLENVGSEAADVEFVDGIHNVLPSGVTRRFQLEFSTLVDGYKRTELAEGSNVALFRLSSVPIDRAEPSEALRVNAAWGAGLPGADVLVSSIQLDRFRAGEALQPESDVRGRRGAFFQHARLALAAGEGAQWLTVAELELDAPAVHKLVAAANTAGIADEVRADVARGTRHLIEIVGKSDGLQATGDEASSWRHFANTLFNVMRGGFPDDGYAISRDDLRAYLTACNRAVATRHASFLASLPDTVERAALTARLGELDDPDLERLCAEYLPLSFSRRHGDPSRPWNSFAIQVRDEHGNKTLNYQGNWRDIFQNWEALALSYPDLLEGMLFKFADSSTVDGFNPYRVSREGYEWEVIIPEDDWAHIGYWGDHQVVYLLRLLEAWDRYRPGSVRGLLARDVFTFADVPYRLRSFDQMVADPVDTIDFDDDLNAAALARRDTVGADGLAVQRGDEPLRAGLAEKLLVVAVSKLTSLVPEAGIWLNTQRPEWNDANNALVGNGVSVVTLCYVRRYLAHLDREFAAAEAPDGFKTGPALAAAVAALREAFAGAAIPASGTMAAADRRSLFESLGRIGEEFRAREYAGRSAGEQATISVDDARSFVAAALAHVEHGVRANRREEGMYHAYNLMSLDGDGLHIRRLAPMLEGQVAAASSGLLSADEVLALLDALRAGPLYREDQRSYILYPDTELPHFLDKNILPPEDAQAIPLLAAMMEAGDDSIVTRDSVGHVHFHASFANAEVLADALDAAAGGPFAELAKADRDAVLAAYESVFDHESFTGRSGTFYKYEGLGSIYWHMVSKLLVAVDEAWWAALANGEPQPTLDRLREHYDAIREGIGAHKTPEEYGAVPLDPYSHTPSFAGVQQPGMTGQVKEDLITRLSEMGVQVADGRVRFVPARVRQDDFLSEPRTFGFVGLDGADVEIALNPGQIGFTMCQVPVVIHRGGPTRIDVARPGGSATTHALVLSPQDSSSLFSRDGEVVRLDVYLGLT